MSETTAEKLAGVAAAPIRIMVWLFSHPKMFVVLIVLVLALVALRNCSAQQSAAIVETPGFQVIAPSAKVAPYLIQTSSRAYYATAYNNDNGVLTLTEYYTYDKKEWVKQTIPLPIPEEFYGKVAVYVRKD